MAHTNLLNRGRLRGYCRYSPGLSCRTLEINSLFLLSQKLAVSNYVSEEQKLPANLVIQKSTSALSLSRCSLLPRRLDFFDFLVSFKLNLTFVQNLGSH